MFPSRKPRVLRALGRVPAALVALSLGACAPTPREPLNLVLVSLDTCRADRLSFYGETERETSPHLDRLAAEAAVFTDCLAASTGTGPSHASLFTGQFTFRHGLVKNGLSIQLEQSLGQILDAAGWTTAGFTGGGYLRKRFGLHAGFGVWEDHGGPLAVKKKTMRTTVRLATEWLAEAPPEPFLIFLHGFDPHCPYWPPDVHRERFAAWYEGDLDVEETCGRHFTPLIESGALGPVEQRYVNDLYDALIVAADKRLATFFDALRERDLLDQSLIAFTSDHGESLGEHDWYGHVRMWEEEARVPFFLRFPHGEHAGRYDHPVASVDLLPTVLEALDLPLAEGLHGRSLLPWLRGEEPAPTERLRHLRHGEYESVRFDQRWKIAYTLGEEGPGERELFDLVADPKELENLAEGPEGAARFEAIYGRYRDWREASAAADARYGGGIDQPELGADEAAELEALGY